MPELPEVETTLRGLEPYLLGQTLTAVAIRAPKLRAPTPPAAPLIGLAVTALTRRSKYILADFNNQTTLLIHLGMSGRLTVSPQAPVLAKHDHVHLTTPRGHIVLNDARRFGLFLHVPTPALATHPLLSGLGPEPLLPTFTGQTLHASLRNKSTAIKPTIMDAKVVVGVGNIYASESLFRARINPMSVAKALTVAQCESLTTHIKQTLMQAIAAGGSTLKDYSHSNGQLGYFQYNFKVYGRLGQPCPTCKTPIVKITQTQRATYFCPTCQA